MKSRSDRELVWPDGASKRMRLVDKLAAKQAAKGKGMNAEDIGQLEKLLMSLGHEWLAFYAALKACELAQLKKQSSDFADVARVKGQLAADVQALEHLNSQIAFAEAIKPVVQRAAKFEGKGAGEGRLKKAIRAYLARHPDAKPRDVWNDFLTNPPKGLKVLQNAQGRYVESRAGDGTLRNTNWERFQNSVAEVRKSGPNPRVNDPWDGKR